jgi:hypothetical protein
VITLMRFVTTLAAIAFLVAGFVVGWREWSFAMAVGGTFMGVLTWFGGMLQADEMAKAHRCPK